MAFDLTGGLGSYQEAEDKYNNKVKQNTGTQGFEKASIQGQIGASTVGANAGQQAAVAANSAGASKGAASALGEGAAQEAAQNAVASETEKAAKQNEKEVEAAKQEADEAQADVAEREAMFDKIGQANNAVGTAALTAGGTAIGGPVGGAIGTGIGAGVNLGRNAIVGATRNSDNKAVRGLGNAANMLLSDERAKVIYERCGYKPRVKKEALFHLLDNIEDKK